MRTACFQVRFTPCVCGRWIVVAALFGLVALVGNAQSVWQETLAKMPLEKGVARLDETNCVPVMLKAFKRNPAVKALIFMPGATDEFYFFHRARVDLTNSVPTLFDAVFALTNQTRICATLHPPFLLLHTPEDPLEPICVVEDQRTAERLKKKKFAHHGVYDDRDWNFIQPLLAFHCDIKVTPRIGTRDSYHFFRHSFSCYDLTAWETLEAVAMAGKTRFKVEKRRVIFEGDRRFLALPPASTNAIAPLR